MTLPDERYRAVKYTYQFLCDLMDHTKTPRVPKAIREQARSCLRHYPSEWDLRQAAEGAPHVFQEQMEPVTRIFMVYKEEQEEQNGK
jgi:hypothetical protein